MTPPPPKHPSGTEPLDREALFDELEKRGEVVRCPACGVGRIPPRLAARVALALPPVDRDAETPREFPAVKPPEHGRK